MGKHTDSVYRIIAEICDEHDVSREQLVGRCRDKLIMDARRQAYKRLRDEAGLSVTLVAKLFGRDHSSVSRAQNTEGWQGRIGLENE